MTKDDGLYLTHMEECLGRIEEYTAEGRQAFLGSTLIQDAVLRNLQTLAESAKRVGAPLRERHPEVPWRDIAGFRNVVVHDYLGVDLDTI
ncbi:MAG: HepT-like ribonuclease domain-containing protein [Candidatus Eiseniibacteriota bacterium]